MKTFAIPVIRTIKTSGHILVEAETLESTNNLRLTQKEISDKFEKHFFVHTSYEILTAYISFQRLFEKQGTDFWTRTS
jgi:hypothetical protein